MMGEAVFYFEDVVPGDYLLRKIDAVLDLSWLRGEGTRTSSFASRQGACLNKVRPITDASG